VQVDRATVENQTNTEPLVYETHGIVGEGFWFRLYECSHITDNEYPIATCVAIGAHANMLFCRHCWAQIKGMVAEELLHAGLHSLPSGNREKFLEQLLQGAQYMQDQQDGSAPLKSGVGDDLQAD
jgi:hypothetical protein